MLEQLVAEVKEAAFIPSDITNIMTDQKAATSEPKIFLINVETLFQYIHDDKAGKFSK